MFCARIPHPASIFNATMPSYRGIYSISVHAVSYTLDLQCVRARTCPNPGQHFQTNHCTKFPKSSNLQHSQCNNSRESRSLQSFQRKESPTSLELTVLSLRGGLFCAKKLSITRTEAMTGYSTPSSRKRKLHTNLLKKNWQSFNLHLHKK